jgi:hypothetical protein
MSFGDAEFSPDASRLLGASHGTEAIKIWETDQYQNLLTLEAEGHFFSEYSLFARRDHSRSEERPRRAPSVACTIMAGNRGGGADANELAEPVLRARHRYPSLFPLTHNEGFLSPTEWALSIARASATSDERWP